MRVAIMGSTGSVGSQALDVVSLEPDRFVIDSLVARRPTAAFFDQVKRVHPRVAGLVGVDSVADVRASIPLDVKVVVGPEAFALAEEADTVVNAITGFAGLEVTKRTLLAGRRLGLANKESLVAAGELVLSWRDKGAGEILPLDSEHSAIFQCLGRTCQTDETVARLVVTASGGPFREWPLEDLKHVTKLDALSHPTWQMGEKITIDSSTLVNKGLEVIEAHLLFGLPYDRIEVVVHPQSVVHSMVEYVDGSVLWLGSKPDMRLPIAVALYYPDRSSSPWGPLDWQVPFELSFGPLETQRFPCFGLAVQAGRAGGGAPCWFNAANESAVSQFLSGKISWIEIYDVLARAMDKFPGEAPADLEGVIDLDARARAVVEAE